MPSLSNTLERKLLETIDELLTIARSCYFKPGQPLRFLNQEERKHLYGLDGRIVGLVAIVQDGKIPFEGRPTHCRDSSRFTPGTGLPCTLAYPGMSIGRSLAWEAKMLSLRAAVQAVIDAQEVKGQTDIRPDTSRKRRNRPLKNLKVLLDLQKAIARGQNLGQTMEETAVEFTDGDEKKAHALLRSLRRNRHRSELWQRDR